MAMAKKVSKAAAPAKQNALRPTIKVKPKSTSGTAASQQAASSSSDRTQAMEQHAQTVTSISATVRNLTAEVNTSTLLGRSDSPAGPAPSSSAPSRGIVAVVSSCCSIDEDKGQPAGDAMHKKARLEVGISGNIAVLPLESCGNEASVEAAKGQTASKAPKQGGYTIQHTNKFDDDDQQDDEAGSLAGLLGGYASNEEEE
jgi:hypothetical protein